MRLDNCSKGTNTSKVLVLKLTELKPKSKDNFRKEPDIKWRHLITAHHITGTSLYYRAPAMERHAKQSSKTPVTMTSIMTEITRPPQSQPHGVAVGHLAHL